MKASVEIDRIIYGEDFLGKNLFWDSCYFSLKSVVRVAKEITWRSLYVNLVFRVGRTFDCI